MYKAKKRFGQNFLKDTRVIHSLIQHINPQAMDRVIEIGPGTGALTSELLPKVAQLTALEIDKDLLTQLEQQYKLCNNLRLIHTDALHYEWVKLGLTHQQTADQKPPNQAFIQENNKIRIVGNLPYNIATPLISRIMEANIPAYDCHFMVQKEVAERITAKPGNQHYGYFSLITAYFAQADYLFTVPPEAFTPQPKVQSAVIRIKPKPTIVRPTLSYQSFQYWLKIFFSHKRKTLGNNIKPYITSTKRLELVKTTENIQNLLTQRAEELDLAQLTGLIQDLETETVQPT